MEVQEQQLGIFACSSCGALFEAPLEYDPSRKCPECGLLVVASQMPAAKVTQKDQPEDGFKSQWRTHSQRLTAKDLGVDIPVEERYGYEQSVRSRNERGKKSSSLLFPIFIGVLFLGVVLSIVAGVIYYNMRNENRSMYSKIVTAAEEEKKRIEEAKQEFIKEHYPSCVATLKSFQASVDPDYINAYIHQSPNIEAKKRWYYQSNLFLRSDEVPKLKYINSIDVQAQVLIESVWQWSDGRVSDVVFINAGEWKIDWEQMVRFSDQVLPMFVSGIGSIDEGIFRVYLRRSAVSDESTAEWTTVSLYEPGQNLNDDDFGKPLTKMTIGRKSKIGQSIEAIYNNWKAGHGAYGSQLLQVDPEDFMRATLKLSRTKEADGKWKISIDEVVSNHWLSIQGVDLKIVE